MTEGFPRRLQKLRERDAAVEDLRKLVPAWQWSGPKEAET